MRELRNVGTAFAQARHVDRYDVQTEVEILAERPAAISSLQIAIGGRDHAHVHGHLVVAAHRPHFLFLQHAQQLGLQFQRQLADFVQKNRAAVGA